MSDFARLMEVARDTTPPPANVDAPLVMGDAAVGATLTCTMGNWNGEPGSYDWRWRRDAADIGATGDTYTVSADDAGHAVDCMVSATNVGGTTAVASNSIQIPSTRSKP